MPNEANQPASFKNEEACEIIERMFGDVTRLNLFPRAELRRPGWTAWENGAPEQTVRTERTVRPDRPVIDEKEIDLD